MAGLHNVDVKIMRIILQHVAAEDFQSFTSTCKGIYFLALGDLPLEREYRICHYQGPDLCRPRHNPAKLLGEILNDGHTASYVQEVSVDNRISESNPGQLRSLYGEVRHLFRNAESVLRIEKALNKRVSVSDLLKVIGSIDARSVAYLICVLLKSLPNLRTLRVKSPFGSESFDTFEQIVSMKGPEASLSRLRHAEVQELQLLVLLALLPSMQSIHGAEIRARESYDQANHLSLRKSYVTELVLTKCSISPKRLFGVLERFLCLGSFTYDSDQRYDKVVVSEKWKFDPAWLRNGLLAFASSTLHSLTLLSHDKDGKFMGHLRRFKAIRNLHTEYQLLVSLFGCHCADFWLAEALPPKLETLKLECSGAGNEQVIADFIARLAGLKEVYVPSLKKVEVTTRNGIEDFNTHNPRATSPLAVKGRYTYEAISEACKAKGFDLFVKKFDPAILAHYEGDIYNESDVLVAPRVEWLSRGV